MIDRVAILNLKADLAAGMSVWITCGRESIQVTDVIGAQDGSHAIVMSGDTKVMLPLDKITMVDIRPPSDDDSFFFDEMWR